MSVNSQPESQPQGQAKAKLRAERLAVRDALAERERIGASAKIAGRVQTLLEDRVGTISAYWPIRSEVDTVALISWLGRMGRSIALPVVLDKTTIEFRRFSGVDTLVPAGFGTMGPGDGADTSDPDILLVPLSAFDRRGGRIGYGAGHYDRAFERLERTRPVLAIGLAFSCQEIDHVPVEAHDRLLDFVVTEHETIKVVSG